VVDRITSSRWNLTGTFTGSFSGEIASFTPKNTEDSIIMLTITAPKTGILRGSPHDDIILFVNAYIAYWSQGMHNPQMGFNHDDKINHDDIVTFIDSYVVYWNGQP
jgi:hypothetical protein